jgi:glucan-binding YG repeat protein
MSKKDSQSQEVLKSETSRRTFLKTSAAVAGAALAGAAVKASSASAATQTKSKGTTPLQDVVARPDLWYYPGEEVAPDEMRVTLMETGWGNIIRPAGHYC